MEGIRGLASGGAESGTPSLGRGWSLNPVTRRGVANIKEIDGSRFVSTIQNPVTGRRALKLGTAVSEKLLKRLGGFLRPLLKHPVPGVLQHDDGHVCRNQLGLLP